MRKIKIAHVQVLPILSGVQNISLKVLANLPSCTYEKYLVCSDSELESPEFAQKFTDAGVTLIRLKHLKREIGLHDFTGFRELRDVFSRYKFDIIHTHSTKPGILARIAGRLFSNAKVIHTIHGVAFHNRQSFLKRAVFYALEQLAVPFGHYQTSVNNFYQRYYPLIRSSRRRTINNGVVLPEYLHQKTANPGTDLNILFLARMEAAKNPVALVKAFAVLTKEYPQLKLTMVGDGELMEQVREVARTLKCEAAMEFVGWVTEPQSYYENADIFCVPSQYEAFGLVFAEAALYQLPVVATSVEGIPEVVKDKVSGTLVTSDDPHSLANALKELIDSPELRERFGRAGQKRVVELFSADKMVESYRQLYEQAHKVN